MLKVTVTAKNSPINIQDPRPTNQTQGELVAYTIEAGQTKDIIVQWGHVERIAQQLSDLEALGLCTFVIAGAGSKGFAEQPDGSLNPVIDFVDDGSITAVSQALVVTGHNLLAGQTIAQVTVPGDTSAGRVVVQSVNPGGKSNDYDIEVVNVGGAGLNVAVNVVAGRTVITVNLGGSVAETCTTVAGIINNPAKPTYGLVRATVGGAGATAIATVRALTPFAGGAGAGMSVTLAGLPCIVVSIVTTGAPIYVLNLATPALGPLGLGAGAPLMLQIRSNSKVTTATLVHA